MSDKLHHVNLEAHVLGVAEVLRLVIGVGACHHLRVGRHEHLLYRVAQILVEHAREHLFRRRGEPLPSQVHVVDACPSQRRVSTLGIFLSHYLVRHDLVEARPVDRTIVGEAQVHVLRRCPLERCRRQPVPVALFAHLPHVAKLLQHGVDLVRVLRSYARIQLAVAVLHGEHGVCSPDVLLRVVVELRCLRVGGGTFPADVVEHVEAVARQLLRYVRRVKLVRVVSVFALLAAILCSRLPLDVGPKQLRGISYVHISRQVLVAVVLVSAFHVHGLRLEQRLVACPHALSLVVCHAAGERQVCAVGVFLACF